MSYFSNDGLGGDDDLNGVDDNLKIELEIYIWMKFFLKKFTL